MFEMYEGFSSTQKERFSTITNKLLSKSFIIGDRQQDKDDYYFVSRNQSLFEEYFKISGWEMSIDRTLKIVQLKNMYNKNRYRFNLYESTFLVVLRLIYHLKKQELSMTDDVIINMGEFHDQLMKLNLSDKPMQKTILRETFKVLRRFNIVSIMGRDVADVETRILIYPSILKIVNADDINEIMKKLENYQTGGDQDEDFEESETD